MSDTKIIAGLIPFNGQGDLNKFEDKYMQEISFCNVNMPDVCRNLCSSIWNYAQREYMRGQKMGEATLLQSAIQFPEGCRGTMAEALGVSKERTAEVDKMVESIILKPGMTLRGIVEWMRDNGNLTITEFCVFMYSLGDYARRNFGPNSL